jgi:hypothetical protein
MGWEGGRSVGPPEEVAVCIALRCETQSNKNEAES